MSRRLLRPEDLRFDPPELDQATVRSIARDVFGLDGELTPLRGERDQNTLLAAGSQRYVLKVSSPSENPGTLDFQCRALEHLEARAPDLVVPRLIAGRDGRLLTEVDCGGGVHAVRLVTFVDGITFDDAGVVSLGALESIGRLQGRMAHAFSDFDHPEAANFMPWALDGGLLLEPALWDALSSDTRAVLDTGRARIEEVSLSMTSQRRQVIHNDAHRGNVLRRDAASEHVAGIIDFGDLVDTVLVADLAVSAASFVGDQPDPVAGLAALARGFHHEFPLLEREAELLPDLVLARLTLNALLIEYQIRHAPHIAEAVAGELPRIIEDLVTWNTIDAVAAGHRVRRCIEED